jgi:hypothetical protein
MGAPFFAEAASHGLWVEVGGSSALWRCRRADVQPCVAMLLSEAGALRRRRFAPGCRGPVAMHGLDLGLLGLDLGCEGFGTAVTFSVD